MILTRQWISTLGRLMANRGASRQLSGYFDKRVLPLPECVDCLRMNWTSPRRFKAIGNDQDGTDSFAQPPWLWTLDGKAKLCREFDTSDLLARENEISSVNALRSSRRWTHRLTYTCPPFDSPSKAHEDVQSTVIRLNRARLWSLESSI